ncbi:MAG: pitrilysin family protein [Bacteroidota bacterium]
MKRFSFLCGLVLMNAIFQKSNAQMAPLATSPGGSIMIEKVMPKSDTVTIPYEKWKLKNGLTLIIQEDHSDPIANIAVQYHVGSARETAGRSGFAHFYEHMMFQGSEHVMDEEHFKLVSKAGGTMNGFTQEDKTVYFEVVPSNSVEMAMWLEADRMGFLLDSVTQNKFEVQRSTVKNEKSQNYENIPYALAFGEVTSGALYPAGHPYSWPVIGFTDDLDRATLNDLKNFFLRWYGPNNAILSISGDVNPMEIVASAEKYFGTIPQCPEVKKPKANVPILASDKYASYVDNIYAPLTLMTFPTVPVFHRDEPALNLLSDMMGRGNNSIFYKNFVKNEKALFALVSHRSLELSGEYQIGLFAYPDPEVDQMKQFDQTEKDIRTTIDEFEKTGITEEALSRERSRRVAQIISGSQTGAESVLGKSISLAEWSIFAPKGFNLADDIDRYNKVTKDDIQRVFNKYIKGKFAAIVNVLPRKPDDKDSTKSYNPYAALIPADDALSASLRYVKAVDSFDRSKRPEQGPPKVPVIPQYYTKTLGNGVKIIGTKTSEVPEVVIQISIKGGDLLSGDVKKVGVAELTAALMDESTANYTAEQISAELDKLGSNISFGAGSESTFISVTTLTKNVDATLKFLEEKLYHPKFDPADFKRIRKQMIADLYQQKNDANTVSSKLFRSLVYGDNIMGAYVSLKNVKKLSIDDVKSYYDLNYSPSVTSVVIAGDISESEILPKLEFLNKWKAKNVVMPPPPVIASPQTTQIYLAHIDFAKTSVLDFGYPGMAYDYSGDYFKSNIMNHPLGGNFNSRLNLDLREQKGLTYGINSSFTGSKYPGIFEINASVRRSGTDTAIAEVMKIIKDFKANGITDEEVAFVKQSRLNAEALRYETPGQKAGFLSRIIDYDLPKDYSVTQENILKSVTKEELNALATKYINPDKMIILVVGNKYAIKSKLEKLGIGKVTEVELD